MSYCDVFFCFGTLTTYDYDIAYVILYQSSNSAVSSSSIPGPDICGSILTG